MGRNPYLIGFVAILVLGPFSEGTAAIPSMPLSGGRLSSGSYQESIAAGTVLLWVGIHR